MSLFREFAERAISYAADAMRARDPESREQYLELAACCLEAAARHARPQAKPLGS